MNHLADHRIAIRTAGAADRILLAGLIRKAFEPIAVQFGLTPQDCPKHPSNCTAAWIDADTDRGVIY